MYRSRPTGNTSFGTLFALSSILLATIVVASGCSSEEPESTEAATAAPAAEPEPVVAAAPAEPAPAATETTTPEPTPTSTATACAGAAAETVFTSAAGSPEGTDENLTINSVSFSENPVRVSWEVPTSAKASYEIETCYTSSSGETCSFYLEVRRGLLGLYSTLNEYGTSRGYIWISTAKVAGIEKTFQIEDLYYRTSFPGCTPTRVRIRAYTDDADGEWVATQ